MAGPFKLRSQGSSFKQMGSSPAKSKFGDEYRKNRNAGVNTFTYEGKSYSTESKSEKESRGKEGTYTNKRAAKANVAAETTPTTQPTDSKDVTSDNVKVSKTRKQKRAARRVKNLQEKATTKGSLNKRQVKKLARNESKAKGEKVKFEDRSKYGQSIRDEAREKEKESPAKSVDMDQPVSSLWKS